jgi:hypothetical protein
MSSHSKFTFCRLLRIYKTEAVKQYILISDITMTEMLCHLLIIQGKACWPRFEIVFQIYSSRGETLTYICYLANIN